MSTLISKVWFYTPNQYTTIFTLSALFADGSESVYEFRKSNSSWAPSGETHDDKLLIVMPSEESHSFRVRAYEEYPFISLSATYGNNSSSAEATRIDLQRFIFDKSFDKDHPYYRYLVFTNNDPWNSLPATIPDIFLTNLTEYLTLPTPVTDSSNIADNITDGWYGWGILNGSYSTRKADPYGGNPDSTSRYMPVSAYITNHYSKLPVIPLKSDIPVGATDANTIFGERDIVQIPSLGGVYRILPIYNKQGIANFHLNSTVQPIHKMTVTVGAHGSVAVTGECQRVYDGWEIPDGGNVVLTATADEGYMFSRWLGGGKNPTLAVDNVTNDMSYTAEFVVKVVHKLTLSGEHCIFTVTGDCEEVSDGWEVLDGGTVTIQAIPNEGWDFAEWNDYDPSDKREITNVTTDLSFSAHCIMKVLE